MSHPIEEPFGQLQDLLNSPSAKLTTSFYEPASVSSIEHLEEIVGLTIPTDLRNFWLIADGQPNDANPIFQESDFIILPVDLTIEAWQFARDFFSDQANCSTQYLETSPEVKISAWEPGWIPFGRSRTGDTICIDLSPTDVGDRGQVIITTLTGVHMLVGRSFFEWFSSQINEIRSCQTNRGSQ